MVTIREDQDVSTVILIPKDIFSAKVEFNINVGIMIVLLVNKGVDAARMENVKVLLFHCVIPVVEYKKIIKFFWQFLYISPWWCPAILSVPQLLGELKTVVW